MGPMAAAAPTDLEALAGRLVAPVWASCRRAAPACMSVPATPPPALLRTLVAALAALSPPDAPRPPPFLTSSDLLRPATYATVLDRPPGCVASGHGHDSCTHVPQPATAPVFVSWCLPAPVPRGAAAAPGSGLAAWDGVRPLHIVHGGGLHPASVFGLIATRAWSLTRRAAGRSHVLQVEAPRLLLHWRDVACAAGYAPPPYRCPAVAGMVSQIAAVPGPGGGAALAIEVEQASHDAHDAPVATILVDAAAPAAILQWCVTPGMPLAWAGLSLLPPPAPPATWYAPSPPSTAIAAAIRAAATCLAGVGGGGGSDAVTDAAVAAAEPSAALWAGTWCAETPTWGRDGASGQPVPDASAAGERVARWWAAVPALPADDAPFTVSYTGALTSIGSAWLCLDNNPRMTLWAPHGVAPLQLLPPGGASLHTTLSLHGVAPLLIGGRVAGMRLVPGRSAIAIDAFPRCSAPQQLDAADGAPPRTLPTSEPILHALYARHITARLLDAFRGLDGDAVATRLMGAVAGVPGPPALTPACSALLREAHAAGQRATVRTLADGACHLIVTPTLVAHFGAAAAAACVAALRAVPPAAHPWLPVYQDDVRRQVEAGRAQHAAVTARLAKLLDIAGTFQGALPGTAPPEIAVAGDWLSATFSFAPGPAGGGGGGAPLLGVAASLAAGDARIYDTHTCLPLAGGAAPAPGGGPDPVRVQAWDRYSVVVDLLAPGVPPDAASPAAGCPLDLPRCGTCQWGSLAASVAHDAVGLDAAVAGEAAHEPSTPSPPPARGWARVPGGTGWYRVHVLAPPPASAVVAAAAAALVPSPLPVLGVRDLLGAVGALWSDYWTAASPPTGAVAAAAAAAAQQVQLPPFTLVGQLVAVSALRGDGGRAGAGASGRGAALSAASGVPGDVAQVRLRLANVSDPDEPGVGGGDTDAMPAVPALQEMVDVYLDVHPRGGGSSSSSTRTSLTWPLGWRAGAVVVIQACTRNKSPSLRVHVKACASRAALAVVPSAAALASLLRGPAAVVAATAPPAQPRVPLLPLAAIHQRVAADCANAVVDVKAAIVSWLRLSWVDATSGALLVGDEVGGVPLPRTLGRVATPLGALVRKDAADATPAVYNLVTAGSFRDLRLVTGNPDPPPATLSALLLKPSFLADDAAIERTVPLTSAAAAAVAAATAAAAAAAATAAAAAAAAVGATAPPAPPPVAPVLRLEVTVVVDDGTAECLVHATDVYDPGAVAALLQEFCDSRFGGGEGPAAVAAGGGRRAGRRGGPAGKWRRRRGLAARLVGIGGGRLGFWGLQALLHGPLQSRDGFGAATWAFGDDAGGKGDGGARSLSAAADAPWRALDCDDDFDANDFAATAPGGAALPLPPPVAPPARLAVPTAVRTAFATAPAAATELFREVTEHVQRNPGPRGAPRWRLLVRQFYTPKPPTDGGASGDSGMHEVVWRATASRLNVPPALQPALVAAAAHRGGDGGVVLVPPAARSSLPMPPRRTTAIDSETAGIRVQAAALPPVHLKAIAGGAMPVRACATSALASLAALLPAPGAAVGVVKSKDT